MHMENLNCKFECMMEWVCVLSLSVEVHEMSQERRTHANKPKKAKNEMIPMGQHIQWQLLVLQRG